MTTQTPTMTTTIQCPQDFLTEEYIDTVRSLRESVGEAREIVDTRTDLHPQIARAYRRFLTEVEGVVRTYEDFHRVETTDVQTLQNLWHLQGVIGRTKVVTEWDRDHLVG